MSAKQVARALLLLLLGGAAGYPQEPPLDRAAAEQYLAQARLRAAAGDWNQAAALLDDALEFYPEYSESCLLYARLRLREQDGTREGLDWLKRALASGTWTASDPGQAATELAGVLVRTRRFAEARPLLSGLEGPSAAPGLGARENPDAALFWARLLRGQGDGADASRHLELALRRYPGDARLYLELARVRRALGGGAQEVLSRGRRALPQAAELTLEAARLERGRPRQELLEEYLRQGGAAPAAAALALIAGARDPAAWQERFLRWQGLAAAGPLAELQAFYRTLPPPLAAAAARYSGARLLDADEDGFYEELYQFQDGALRSWLLDRDQDGMAEAAVDFAEGLPLTLTEGDLQFRFSSYPFLEQVTARDGRGQRTYELPPYRERLVLFAGSAPFGGSLLRLAAGRRPTEAQVARLALARREAEPGGAERRYVLQAGQVVRLEEDPGPDGGWGRIVEYSGGLPVAGRRDLDRDGIFEVREEYAGGRLSGLSVDSDGDGRPEYRELPGGRQVWDYDEDGRPDSRELQTADGLLREFSSRRDGVFDSAALFRGDRLVEFRRGGRTLPVTQADDGLYWVGAPAGGPERFLALPDGLHRLNGGSYFLFSYAGRRYVEKL